jgi:hypothetical protein
VSDRRVFITRRIDVSDADKLREVCEAVDEYRRLQNTTNKPPNHHERKALDAAAREVDRLLVLHHPGTNDTDVIAREPAPREVIGLEPDGGWGDEVDVPSN